MCISTERENLRKIARTIPGVSGATYIRWGRDECPPSADLIYKGRGAGSWYLSGGGSNVQCFPEDPAYLNTTGRATESRVHGLEYEVWGGQYFDSFKHMREKNVPCVVCQTQYRSSVLMTPAKTECEDQSWTLEYNGYLMAGGPAHQRMTFICVDKDPGSVPGMDDNKNGELLYHTGVYCKGFGQCPPYRDGAELACVVCSK